MTAPREPRPVRRRAVPLAHAQLEGLYRALFLRLARRAARRYRLSGQDALECVQDVFVLALRVGLSDEGNPRVWLYRTLDNLAANWMRKEIRRKALTARWGATELQPNDRADGLSGGEHETR